MSKTITVETIINAPLDEVWDEVSKIENHSNWMKDAVNIDFQTNSRTGVGTKIKVLTKIGPIKLYDYMTFTKWEDKNVIGVDHVGIVKGKGEMQFSWAETLVFPFYLGGPIGEFFGKPIFNLIWKENLKNLKKEIEK